MSDQMANAIINPPNIPTPPRFGIRLVCDLRSSGSSNKCFTSEICIIDGIAIKVTTKDVAAAMNTKKVMFENI